MDNTDKIRFVIIGLLMGLCLIILAACNNTENNPDTGPGNMGNSGNSSNSNDAGTTPEDSETPSEDVILAAWESSPHANSFVVDSAGENNPCARCHAPINWMPTLEEIPPACFTCKFEVDPPDPLIPEENWESIPCYQCHEKGKKDTIKPEVLWLEVPAVFEEYTEVSSPTVLCQKCHGEALFEGHGVVEVGGAHVDYGCTDCHDAHDTVASCGSVDCHEAVVSASSGIPGHDEDHQNVSCEACHDGAGMTFGFREEDQVFTTFYTLVTEAGESSSPFTSHNIVLESQCDRCHFSANPWDLTDNVTQP